MAQHWIEFEFSTNTPSAIRMPHAGASPDTCVPKSSGIV